jgi:hypothetical protein
VITWGAWVLAVSLALPAMGVSGPVVFASLVVSGMAGSAVGSTACCSVR